MKHEDRGLVPWYRALSALACITTGRMNTAQWTWTQRVTAVNSIVQTCADMACTVILLFQNGIVFSACACALTIVCERSHRCPHRRSPSLFTRFTFLAFFRGPGPGSRGSQRLIRDSRRYSRQSISDRIHPDPHGHGYGRGTGRGTGYRPLTVD